MQDRFKFRGKRLDNGQWYYGSYLYLHNAPQYKWDGDKTQTKEDAYYIIDGNDVNYEVDIETVGQCTGVKDKNKNFVYEGDIVKLFDDIKLNDKDYGIYEIRFMQEFCGFCLYSKNFVSDFGGLHPTDIEVIGNKYENPELLKGGEEC